MMFNENGVAYAPWISKQIDEDAIVEDLIRKEKSTAGGAKKTTVLERGEIEASEGMRWRMNGDQVELAWITGGEADNKGYIVEKRPSYGGDFQEIATFKEVSQLASKGVQGGRYKYTDPSTAAGSWIYRVQDCDAKGAKVLLVALRVGKIFPNEVNRRAFCVKPLLRCRPKASPSLSWYV